MTISRSCFLSVSFCLFLGVPFPSAYAQWYCILKAERSTCSDLPVIRSAILNFSKSEFELHARYEACFSIRAVYIKGRVSETVSTENVKEYELLGEVYEPVSDFVPFPRTVAHIVLETHSGKGHFTDVWSTQRIHRYPSPALLTSPISCRESEKE